MESIAQRIKAKSSILKSSYDFSICPTCNGTGWRLFKKDCSEIYGTESFVDYVEPCPTCNGGLAERAEEAKKKSDIPTVFYDKKYESFNWKIYKDTSGNVVDMSKTQRLVENFLLKYPEWKSQGLGFYISSKTKGSGKSYLASCLCNSLMEMYAMKTKFVNATKLLDISQSGDKDSPDEYKREPIKLLCNCELLVIDDLGQKKSAYDWMNDILFRIVDDRMTKKLVTVFTSNLSIEELALDDRIVERINKVSFPIKLPEYNVRSRESNNAKLRFIKSMGLMEGGE